MDLVGDFETTTDPKNVRVWASCLVEIPTGQTVGLWNNIDGMFEYLSDKNTTVYFHNLKFDGEFIISYLLQNGYTYSREKNDKTFHCLITDMGVWYSITVIFKKHNKRYEKVEFRDSLKKLPFPVSRIAKAFHMDMCKLEIDYTAPRPVGHILTAEEKEYIEVDCKIVASALNTQFSQGLEKMTIGSDALNSFKKMIGKKQFESLFPVLPVPLDASIRQAYRGGFTYLKPEYAGKEIGEGIVFDVNSLYPSRMYECLLPYGYPTYFNGEYQPDESHPLYIQHMRFDFELKHGHIPTIQLKNNRAFISTEYLTSSKGEQIEMSLTNVDLELIRLHYDLYNVEYLNGFKFQGMKGVFCKYIDFWNNIKMTSTGALRELAKLMLNNLYGKFATATRGVLKEPYLENGVVKYKDGEAEEKDSVYTAMACFITAYARDKTIRTAQQVYDRFIYADTDSLHLIGTEVPEEIEVDPVALGKWKHEGTFSKAKFLRAKTYMETVDGVTTVKCAGMPDTAKKEVTYSNFKTGGRFGGKLTPKRYKGGVVLTPVDFTIKK